MPRKGQTWDQVRKDRKKKGLKTGKAGRKQSKQTQKRKRPAKKTTTVRKRIRVAAKTVSRGITTLGQEIASIQRRMVSDAQIVSLYKRLQKALKGKK